MTTNTETTTMTSQLTFNLTTDQIVGALVHNESYVNSILNNIYGTDLWQQVKCEALDKYIEANEDNMRDLAIEHMMENDEDGIREAAAQQLIDECDDDVREAAIQQLLDDGDFVDEAIRDYIQNNDDIRESAIEKIIDEDDGKLHRAAVKYYIEAHEESCMEEAAKLYQQNNFADVENAAVEALTQSIFNGDPYGLTIKVAKAWAEHRKQDAQDLEAQIEDIKKKQQELELAIAKLGI